MLEKMFSSLAELGNKWIDDVEIVQVSDIGKIAYS